MKRLTLLLLAPLIFSCGGNSSEKAESGNVLENFSFSIDTVVMDPGDQLVNLQSGPSKFDLSPDKRLYYFIHRSLGVLSVFDLEEKKLIKQLQFEKEGPNAIPNFVSSFHAFDENRFLLTGFGNIGIYDSAGVEHLSIPFGTDQFTGLSDDEG